MKNWIYYFVVFVTLNITIALTACDDWLDVKSETEYKEEDIYDSKSGFCNVLTGIYMEMAGEAAYGKRLTMADIEELACLWYCNGYDYNPGYYYLRSHEYTNDYSKECIKIFYQSLFNTITQTNVLIKNIENNSSALNSDQQLKYVIEGEAYAIKAYCQFDILRIFGQLPNGLGTKSVRLPYSNTTSINEIPKYYDYDEYVQRLMSDVDHAIEILEDYDPVRDYTYAQLSSTSSLTLDDDYLYYRRQRLNYWAAKALRARINLYLGNTDAAHDEALEVINATTRNGDLVCTLNADNDLDNGYNTLPSEHLFSLSKYDMFNYTNSLFIGRSGAQVTPNSNLVLSQDMLSELFRGVSIASNNRYLQLWNRQSTSSTGTVFPSLCKYYFNTSDGSASIVYQSLIPMIRLSEMYLIAMETTSDIDEANVLYSTYMRDHNTLVSSEYFASLTDVKAEVMNEYRREFIAEGQMFYAYKRTFTRSILWGSNEMSENDYIVPLPDTEYDNE